MGVLSRRERRTLEAAARTLVPSGGSIPHSADDLGLTAALTAEIDGYPRRARRRTKLLLFAVEHLPLVSGHRRRFSRLSEDDRLAVLEANGRHRRSPVRRLIVSLLKQVVYSSYISQPAVEDAVGYRYECVLPLEGPTDERTHH